MKDGVEDYSHLSMEELQKLLRECAEDMKSGVADLKPVEPLYKRAIKSTAAFVAGTASQALSNQQATASRLAKDGRMTVAQKRALSERSSLSGEQSDYFKALEKRIKES